MTSSTADLEVFRLSAEGCGYPHTEIYLAKNELWVYRKWPDPDDNGGVIRWDPFTNDSQRWECVEKLLTTERFICFEGRENKMHAVFSDAISGKDDLSIQCPASEFPARALAELQKRKSR